MLNGCWKILIFLLIIGVTFPLLTFFYTEDSFEYFHTILPRSRSLTSYFFEEEMEQTTVTTTTQIPDTFPVKMQKRRQYVSEICKAYRRNIKENVTLPKKDSSLGSKNFPVLTEKEYYRTNDSRFDQTIRSGAYSLIKPLRLSYCWLHKVGSSSMYKLLSKYYKSKMKETDLYKLAFRFAPKTLSELRGAVEDYQSVMLIRHPLHRLISAYRDRLQKKKAPVSTYKTIAKFLGVTHTNTMRTQVVSHKYNRSNPIYLPSFQEFVRYIVHQPYMEMDGHWELYSHHCSPCIVNFTYIVEMEDRSEYDELLKATNISKADNVVQLNSSGNRSSSHAQTVREYVAQMSCEHLRSFYDKYYPDFVLFNYNMDSYVPFANNGAGCPGWDVVSRPQDSAATTKTTSDSNKSKLK